MSKTILAIVKRFLPQIKQSALPTITGVLKQVTEDVKLQDGEDSACIMVSQYNGEWWAYVVTTTPENAISRIVKQMKLDDLLSSGLEKIDKNADS